MSGARRQKQSACQLLSLRAWQEGAARGTTTCHHMVSRSQVCQFSVSSFPVHAGSGQQRSLRAGARVGAVGHGGRLQRPLQVGLQPPLADPAGRPSLGWVTSAAWSNMHTSNLPWDPAGESLCSPTRLRLTPCQCGPRAAGHPAGRQPAALDPSGPYRRRPARGSAHHPAQRHPRLSAVTDPPSGSSAQSCPLLFPCTCILLGR